MKDSAISDTLYENYKYLLLQNNNEKCFQIVETLITTGIQIKDIYVNLFQRSMYDIGYLWEINQISVATEHIVTSITERILARIYPKLFNQDFIKDKRAIIACTQGEYHQIGAKMVADMMELNGWDTYFLGANTPIQDLLDLIQNKKPDVVGLSLSVFMNFHRLQEMAEKIISCFPTIKIMVGGQAFRLIGDELFKKYKNISYLSSLEELEKFIEEIE